MSTISDKFKYKKAQKLEQQGNIQEAIDIYKELANAGYPEAQYKYGTLYEEGKYLPKSEAEAVRWYAKSATGDCADGYNELGRCYYYGTGMKAIDYKKAFECFKYAAYKDHPKAQFNLAVCFENGRGTTHSKVFQREAFNWYKESALNGYSKAQYHLAECYKNQYGTNFYIDKAIHWYTRSAENGYVKAHNALGDIYYYGYGGTSKDLDTALSHYKIAAEGGIADSQYKLGNCYKEGKGTEKNYKAAFDWYEKAAGQGKVLAQNALANCFEEGHGTNKNIEKALEWYEKAGEQENVDALLSIASIYIQGKEVEKDAAKATEYCEKAKNCVHDSFELKRINNTLKIIEDSIKADIAKVQEYAELNVASAQFELGKYYHYGTGVTKDIQTAAQWYEKAALQDYEPACMALANLCYEQGDSVKAAEWCVKIHRINVEAKALIEKIQNDYEIKYINARALKDKAILEKATFDKNYISALCGDADAQNSVGCSYYNSTGVTKDFEKAFTWFKKSALQGDKFAQSNLGICYEYGNGTDQNLKEAFNWYEKSALQGFAKAQYNLGLCYEFGKGTEKNLKEAFNWYEKAALQGYARAQCNLGTCYYNGDGTLKDYNKAVEFYEKAALQGYERAQFNLAVCFELEKNIDTAIEWYEKAASQGHKRAYFRLANIYYNGSDNVEKDLKKALNFCSKSDLTLPHIKALYDKIQKEILEEKELRENKRLARLEQILAYRFDREDPVFSLPTELENNTVFNYMKSGEIYHLAVKKEQEGKTDHAIFLYGVAASKGNRKALYTLSNMSQHDTEYFMFIEDHSNKEGEE